MKILTSAQIKSVEQQTLITQNITSADLMARAASEFVFEFINHASYDSTIYIFCGPGNNGGDGIAMAGMLLKMKYKVHVYLLENSISPDATFFASKLPDYPQVLDLNALPKLTDDAIIIDALFGIGMNRNLEGKATEIINWMNASNNKIYSVDIPSGLYADEFNKEEDCIVRADYTFTFHSPKISFLLCENENKLGSWKVLPIGLDESTIDSIDAQWQMIEENEIALKLKTRVKCSHKGMYGRALMIAGSHGKMGAAVLTTKACLRAGAGLVTSYIPKGGYTVMQTATPESMVLTDENSDYITSLPKIKDYKAVGIGPGIGTNKETATSLSNFISNLEHDISLVLDADALNIISGNVTLLSTLPQNTILTPHPIEFDRLTQQKHDNQWVRMKTAESFAIKYQVVLVLKGAYTSIHLPDGSVYINTTGNAGMATGGSGDVLTGIITGLLAQGYLAKDAAIIGVNLHGMAGDLAARKLGMEAMLPGNIINHIGKAYLKLHKIKDLSESNSKLTITHGI